MIRAPKSKSQQKLGTQSGYRQSDNLTFGLEPAEFEALIYRLCSCGTLRIDPGSPRPLRRRCCRRPCPLVWCRRGERGATGVRAVETRFG
jgi:hypothetical protein